MTKFWINTVNRNHVLLGSDGGFFQANHGKRRALDRMHSGDVVVFYSPRESFESKASLQRFTAAAVVADEPVYQVEMSPDFRPFRRNARFLECREAEIRPLIEHLAFIEDKTRWGYKFRFGVFEIPRRDFELIADAMELVLPAGQEQSLA
ncbi:MAG: EVE domain-containing protein [Caldilineae bacterium]|nr:EVE domain-containing protein [Anaerolineae bacterium]MCB0198506.1 EVE domain-containing protein [Anaerolineae bacterium]MCB0205874.1 EVE domain-containing protein [Anaerolineae bacterium]MCB0255580.1 EVE domain-containing protein [Anaerolineae bacterium]MCB9152970.1 EVE domain-containing protein [Caldilineae bacterium]